MKYKLLLLGLLALSACNAETADAPPPQATSQEASLQDIYRVASLEGRTGDLSESQFICMGDAIQQLMPDNFARAWQTAMLTGQSKVDNSAAVAGVTQQDMAALSDRLVGTCGLEGIPTLS